MLSLHLVLVTIHCGLQLVLSHRIRSGDTKYDILYTHFLWDVKHVISARGSTNPHCAHSHLSYFFGFRMNNVFIIKVKIFVLIKWSHKLAPQFMLTIKPRIVSKPKMST